MDKIGCTTVIPYWGGGYVGLNDKKGRGFILPGGKYEPDKDKTYHDTAIREVKEEVGLDLNEVEYIWHGPDGFGYTCFAFKGYEYRGELVKETEEGYPCIVTYDILMKSNYAPYYKVLFEILDKQAT